MASAIQKVLHLIDSMEVGGAQSVVADLAAGLRREEFLPEVALLRPENAYVDALEKSGVKVFSFDKRGRADFRLAASLRRLIRGEKIRILHAHLFSASLWGRLASVGTGVPVTVVTLHSCDFWKNAFHVAADRLLAARTSHFIAVSEAVKQFYIQREKLPPDKITVIRNGVPCGPEVKIRNRTPDPERVVFCAMGRFAPEKRFSDVLAAFRQLSCLQPGFRMKLAGDGILRRELETLVSDSGLAGRVTFTGFLRDPDAAFADVDVFVNASEREGLPLAVLNAMARGIPVVATRVGGVPEAVEDGRTGILVPPRHPQALADAMARLGADPVRRIAMGEAGRRRVENEFSAKKMVGETEELYRRLLTPS